jgi:microcystin-dependent protein
MKILFKTGMVSGFAFFAMLSTASLNEAQACGPDDYIGTICTTGANYCPDGYQQLNGQLLSIQQFTALYAITGTAYGGNGQTDFGVPDVRGREVVHQGQGPGLEQITRGEYTGFELAHIPSNYWPEHTHNLDFSKTAITASIVASNAPASVQVPANNYFADTTAAPNYSATSNVSMASGSVIATASTGSGSINATGQTPASQTTLSAIGPQIGLLYCVMVEGLFPPKS